MTKHWLQFPLNLINTCQHWLQLQYDQALIITSHQQLMSSIWTKPWLQLQYDQSLTITSIWPITDYNFSMTKHWLQLQSDQASTTTSAGPHLNVQLNIVPLQDHHFLFILACFCQNPGYSGVTVLPQIAHLKQVIYFKMFICELCKN